MKNTKIIKNFEKILAKKIFYEKIDFFMEFFFMKKPIFEILAEKFELSGSR